MRLSNKWKKIFLKVKYFFVEMKNKFKEQCALVVTLKIVFQKYPFGSSTWMEGIMKIQTGIKTYNTYWRHGKHSDAIL